jgi:hypothetical protein
VSVVEELVVVVIVVTRIRELVVVEDYHMEHLQLLLVKL